MVIQIDDESVKALGKALIVSLALVILLGFIMSRAENNINQKVEDLESRLIWLEEGE